MCNRLLNRFVSNPVSSSCERSGLRNGLPGFDARRPDVGFPVFASFVVIPEVTAEYVARADVAPGCTPLTPNAVRKRNALIQSRFGKNDSSERSQDALSLGYFTFWNFVPNALF